MMRTKSPTLIASRKRPSSSGVDRPRPGLVMIGKSGSGTPFDYSIPLRCRYSPDRQLRMRLRANGTAKPATRGVMRIFPGHLGNDPNQVAHEAEHYQEEHELDGRVTAQTPPCDDCVDAPHGLIVPAKSDTVLGGQSNASER